MFNQAAGKKGCKTEEGGPRGSCLGPGTSPSSIWAREIFGTGREKYLGPGARTIWDAARKIFGTRQEKSGTWRKKIWDPAIKIWDPVKKFGIQQKKLRRGGRKCLIRLLQGWSQKGACRSHVQSKEVFFLLI